MNTRRFFDKDKLPITPDLLGDGKDKTLYLIRVLNFLLKRSPRAYGVDRTWSQIYSIVNWDNNQDISPGPVQ